MKKRKAPKFEVRKKNEVIAASALCITGGLAMVVICLICRCGIWVTLVLSLTPECFGLPWLIYSAVWCLTVRPDSMTKRTLFRTKTYLNQQIRRVELRHEFREGECLRVVWEDGSSVTVSEQYKNYSRFHSYILTKHTIEWKT